MTNYSKSCDTCGRRINMRLMPHGKWVAFEGEGPHKCHSPAKRTETRRPSPTAAPTQSSATPFTPFYPVVPDTPVVSPKPTEPPNHWSKAPAGTPPPPNIGLPQGQGAPNPTLPAPARPAPAPETPLPKVVRQQTKSSGALWGILGGILGSSLGLAFALFGLLSLPLSVLAFVHQTGWSWFPALLAVAFLSMIPLAGQLAFIVLAAMGAYYFWQSGFDYQKAAYPDIQTFSVSTLSPSELERFKGNVLRPNFERACKAEALKTSGFNEKLPDGIAKRCECVAKEFVTKLTRDDLIAYESTGAYSTEIQNRIAPEVRRSCSF